MLRARGFTTEQVQQVKEKNWAFFLKRCRRLVPPPRELLARFDKVIEEFGNCIDNDSREVLLRPKSRKAVRLLRKHIEAGCLSDPDGVAMYYVIGKTKDGLVNYRCVRGTNDVEVKYLQLDLRFTSARCRLYSARICTLTQISNLLAGCLRMQFFRLFFMLKKVPRKWRPTSLLHISPPSFCPLFDNRVITATCALCWPPTALHRH